MKCTLSLLLVTVVHSTLSYTTYNGYKLLRVIPQNVYQVEQLRLMADRHNDLDFWKDPSVKHVADINVPPYLDGYVQVAMRKMGLVPEVIQEDVGKLIKQNSASNPEGVVNKMVEAFAEQGMTIPNMKKIITGEQYAPWRLLDKINQLKQTTMSQLSLTSYVVGRFARHDDILAWLEEMVNTHPSLADIEDIGTTYEGRTMRVIKVGSNPGSTSKPIIWVDSAIHAREWLTVGTTTWIINKMLTSYGTDSEVTGLMNDYVWYFLPVANPDGYEYTHTNDRLWRKTRTPTYSRSCTGVDPNRNWDSAWGVAGSSSNACSSTYMGPSAFSEKCTQNMRDIIMRESGRIKLYMAVHSYSQMWLTPYGFGDPKPDDYSELLNIANQGNAALRAVHGTRFVVGTPPDILYAASGGAYDWAKQKAGIKYAYTYELRPDGNAWNGFVVSETEIEPSGEEVWASLAKVASLIS